MQVTHVQDHVTHVVIGGAETIDMGISDSAEFFNILSSTLYTDQKLAVIRETLCNGWDTHVDSDIMHLPLIVTLTSEKLTIMDRGPGIPHTLIGPVYGVYGASTKKHDGKQTGGFGLGCKSPFAYTDHFGVTSCHEGTKTIYEMSKSSGEVQGKPGIKPIVSFPTDETGITVSIDLKSPSDKKEFETLIKRIARNGAMNVELNGTILEKIPFDTMKNDFMVTHDDVYPNSRSRVFVRYGHVIYPVDDHQNYAAEYRKVVSFLDRLPRGYSNSYRMVFQAPAHSISVTPSRESLSMQTHTIKTVGDMLTAFLRRWDGELETESYKVMHQRIDSVVADKKHGLLFNTEESLPRNLIASKNDNNYMVEVNALTHSYLNAHYPAFAGFRKADVLARVYKLINSNLGPRGLLQSFANSYKKETKQAGFDPDSWLQRRVVAPLIMKMIGTEMNAERLIVFGHGVSRKWGYGDEFKSACQASVAAKMPMEHYLPYLRNIIVLSHTRIELDKQVRAAPEIVNNGGAAVGYLAYICPRSKKKVEAAREFFKDMVVIDLTDDQEVERGPRGPAAPRKKGFVCFGSAISDDGKKAYNFGTVRTEEAARVETPKWYSRLEKKNREGNYAKTVGKFDEVATRDIIFLFGSEGAVIQTQIQEDNLRKQGAENVELYVRQQVCAYIQSAPSITDYLQFAAFRVCPEDDRRHYGRDATSVIYEMCLKTKLLRDEFGLVDNRSAEDRRYMRLYRRFINNIYYEKEKYPFLADAQKFTEAVPVNVNALNLKKLISGNSVLELLDTEKVGEILNSDPAKNKEQIDKTLKILLIAMKG